ncbi:C6 zinc finger domain protein [Mariannaea sp. PMI_226]|nr:C6 zinc finger domain protein [Mariannaea sp. PMI_226]
MEEQTHHQPQLLPQVQPLRQEAAQQLPPPEQTHPRRRRRPALSCRECRRRKIKCDQKNPCAHCTRHDTQCIYQPFQNHVEPTLPVPQDQSHLQVPPVRNNNDSPNGPTISTVGQSQREQSAPPDSQSATSRSATASTVPRASTVTSSSCSQVGSHDHNVDELLKRIQKLEELIKSQAHGNTTSSIPLSEAGSNPLKRRRQGLGSHDWQTVLNKPRDLGRGGWTDTAQEFAGIIVCWGEIMGKQSTNPGFRDSETATLIAQAGDLLNKCKRTAKSIKLVRPTRGLSSSIDLLTPPTREVCDTMAKLYFDSFESTYRILHAPSFWDDYQKYWDHPESATPDLRLTVLLVIGIGSSLFDHGSPEASLRNAELVHHWIYAAEVWLAGPLEKDCISLPGLQVYCLTILARQIFSMGGDTVWVSMGSLIHRAMQVGLHRDPKHLPSRSVTVLQAEVRRRLWATILELVVQASLDSRMPPRISFDEFDTEPPLNIDDSEMDESTVSVQPHAKDHFTSASIQLALLDSFPTRLRIVELLNSISADIPYHHVLTLSSELTDALRVNGRLMQDTPESTPFQRNLLDYLVRRFITPLHFPFSNQTRENPLYHYSLKLSLDAATAIMSPEEDAAFSRLMASGGGMFREGLRVAMAAPCLELLVHAQEQRLDGTIQRASRYRELLKETLRAMISLSETRIRHGETNVKSHMFQSMILAQAEAIELDRPVEKELARSARDSLEYCYDILKARAKNMSASVSTPNVGLGGSDMDVNQGLDAYNLDFDWDAFLPSQNFINGMDM